MGTVSRALLTPLIGLLLVFMVATSFERVVLLKVVSALSAIAVVAILVLIPLFTLDILELRNQLQTQVQNPFDVMSLVALVKYLVAAGILAAFARAGFKATRRARARVEQRSFSPSGTLIASRS